MKLQQKLNKREKHTLHRNLLRLINGPERKVGKTCTDVDERS